MTRDVVLAKGEIVERRIRRARDEFAGNAANLRDNLTKQDSIVLNLQRACEAAIDLAMHLVADARLGVPQDSRDAFVLLEQGAGLSAALSESLRRMVGFRNVAVHDYRALSLDVVQAIVEHRADDLLAFARWAIAL
jgi:uncharacterized protein YutE (UPF0331/DUF86 family)